MRQEYADYFQTRLSDARQFEHFRFVIDMVPETWREDARFFLAANIILMVLEPYLRVEIEELDRARQSIEPLIRADIERISILAETLAEKRGRDYVSATSVSIALGQLAPNLETTALEIWGPRAPESEPEDVPQGQPA